MKPGTHQAGVDVRAAAIPRKRPEGQGQQKAFRKPRGPRSLHTGFLAVWTLAVRIGPVTTGRLRLHAPDAAGQTRPRTHLYQRPDSMFHREVHKSGTKTLFHTTYTMISLSLSIYIYIYIYIQPNSTPDHTPQAPRPRWL